MTERELEVPRLEFRITRQLERSRWWPLVEARTIWRWQLVSEGNSEVLASGEGFTTKRAAIESVDLIRRGAGQAPIRVIQ